MPAAVTGWRNDSPNNSRWSRVPHQASRVPSSSTEVSRPIMERDLCSPMTLFAIGSFRTLTSASLAIDRNQVIRDLQHLVVRNMRAVNVLHLFDFAQPRSSGKSRLHRDVSRRMANHTCRHKFITSGAWREHWLVVRHHDGMNRAV